MTNLSLLVKDGTGNSRYRSQFQAVDPSTGTALVDVNGLPIIGDIIQIEPPFVTDAGGDGAYVPAGSAIGVSLGTMPVWANGILFYVDATDSVEFGISHSVPTMAGQVIPLKTVSGNITTGTGPVWGERLAFGQNVIIFAISGTPRYRWSR